MPTEGEKGFCKGFGHITFWVCNAKQAASYYCTRMGFRPLAYRGFGSGSKDVTSYVVQQNKVTFVLQSPVKPNQPPEMTEFLAKHGDAIKDIGFEVDDVDAIMKHAQGNGAKVIEEPHDVTDSSGTIRLAVIEGFGSVTHTLYDRSNYKGLFMPGYTKPREEDPLLNKLPPVEFQTIDHIVVALLPDGLDTATKRYEDCLKFDQSYVVTAKMLNTKNSSMNVKVVANKDRSILMPLGVPDMSSKGKGPLQELVEYHGGATVAHVALSSEDIVSTVAALRDRGFEIMPSPRKEYYEDLREGLQSASIQMTEKFEEIEKNHLLVDFDAKGYLVQNFSKPVECRPTLYFEMIQRKNMEGFGLKNYKALYEAVESAMTERE